jgi:hypothetical protein
MSSQREFYRDRRTSVAAILGFGLALLGIAPLALAFSIVGFLETREGDVRGWPFAVAGVLLGGFGTLVLVAWFLIWFFSRG